MHIGLSSVRTRRILQGIALATHLVAHHTITPTLSQEEAALVLGRQCQINVTVPIARCCATARHEPRTIYSGIIVVGGSAARDAMEETFTKDVWKRSKVLIRRANERVSTRQGLWRLHSNTSHRR